MTLVTTTFDPNNKSSAFTLSNSNLTAVVTSGTGTVRSTRSCPGLTYFEIATSNVYSGTPRVGIANPGGNLNDNLGVDNYAVGYNSTGNVYINGTSVASVGSWSAGANIGIAVDTIYQVVWFRVNGGNWNGNVSYTPGGTVTGGISLTTMTGNQYMPAIGAVASAGFTANFLSGSWSYSAPSGFVAISSVVLSANYSGNTYQFSHTANVSTGSQRLTQAGDNSGCIGFTPGNASSPLAANVTVSGSIEVLSSPSAKLVTVYDQKTGQYLGSTTSNVSTGDFSLLCNGRGQVFVVAQDPTTYQALIYDNITPG